MPRPNRYDAPVCPICAHDLARNGKTKLGKPRWRCCYCKEFNETANSISPHANIRTGYGFTKKWKLGVYNKPQTDTGQIGLSAFLSQVPRQTQTPAQANLNRV